MPQPGSYEWHQSQLLNALNPTTPTNAVMASMGGSPSMAGPYKAGAPALMEAPARVGPEAMSALEHFILAGRDTTEHMLGLAGKYKIVGIDWSFKGGKPSGKIMVQGAGQADSPKHMYLKTDGKVGPRDQGRNLDIPSSQLWGLVPGMQQGYMDHHKNPDAWGPPDILTALSGGPRV